MEIYPHLLWQLLFSSFLGGVLLGALYDGIRLSRVLFGVCHYVDISPRFQVRSPFPVKCRAVRKRGTFWQDAFFALQDLGFCLSAGILVTILLFYGNDGGFRGFVIPGIAAGFLLYYVTLGALLIRCSEYLIYALKTAVLYAVFYITRPFLLLARLIIDLWKRVYCAVSEKMHCVRLGRYDAAKRKQLLKMSDSGFVGLSWNENGEHQIYTSK